MDAVLPAETAFGEIVSPELALVCPELRERSLVLLPERDPDAWIPERLAPPQQARTYPLPVAAGAYALGSSARVALLGVKVAAALAALTVVAEAAAR